MKINILFLLNFKLLITFFEFTIGIYLNVLKVLKRIISFFIKMIQISFLT
jgi:hypothetical protein